MTDRLPRVAAIGVGYWGRNIARNFAELGALAAVCDAHTRTAASVAEETGVHALALDEILSDGSISGVAIATSAPTHFAVALRALERGKHVFVEKPLVLERRHADELIELAQAQGKVLMVGHLLRYHPVFQRMVEIVSEGELGALKHIQSDRQSLGKIRTEEDVMWSFAPHDISMVLALAGTQPSQVDARGTSIITQGIADIVSLQMRFDSGLTADIRASWLHPVKLQQLVAICEGGAVVFRDSEADWSRKLGVYPYAIADRDGAFTPERGEMRFIDVARDEPLRCECRHFLESITGGLPALTNGQEGRAVLDVLQAASRSLENNS